MLSDAEVLTTNGWKNIDTITLEDKVAILDNDNVKYENPIKTLEYDYEGKMYELKSQQVDLTTTPDHRMWVKKRYGKGSNYKKTFEFITADKCFNRRLKYKKNINNFEPDIWIGDSFTIPAYDGQEDKIVLMEDWIQFFGIWIAEGWVNQNNVEIAANKLRVQKVFDKCMTNMGYQIKKTKPNEIVKNVEIKHCRWSINDIQLAKYMSTYSVGAVNKFLPEWVWSLNKDQCRLLLSSLELGDGYTSKSNNRFYYTSSKKLCDDVSRLALHAGYSTNCRVPEGRKKGSIYHFKGREPGFTNEDNWVITIIKTKNEPEVKHGHSNVQNGQDENWIDYSGKVYCLTVRTGVFMVRQNGKPVWTGNCRAAQKGTVGAIYQQQDMPYNSDGICPDIVINPHCVPSRMTLSILLECVLGKSCLKEGVFGDSTPFTSNSHDIAEKLAQRLEENGYQREGWETLYSGFTGEPIKAKVFMGPIYYNRLKHIVRHKIHSRSRGNVTTLKLWESKDILKRMYLVIFNGETPYNDGKSLIILTTTLIRNEKRDHD